MEFEIRRYGVYEFASIEHCLAMILLQPIDYHQGWHVYVYKSILEVRIYTLPFSCQIQIGLKIHNSHDKQLLQLRRQVSKHQNEA